MVICNALWPVVIGLYQAFIFIYNLMDLLL